MKIVISSGHGLRVAGASGLISEVAEARNVVDKVAEYMRQAGAEVETFHENVATTPVDNLAAIIAYHNSFERDLDVSVHFNSDKGGTHEEAMGTETLYFTAADLALAAQVSSAIAAVAGFKDRGAKLRTDLGFLARTVRPAILIEVCFVNSREDVRLYRERFDDICRAIAEAITGMKIPTPAPPAKDTHWAQDAVDHLADVGIMLTDARYDDAMTRGEVVALLARYDKTRFPAQTP